jgi:phage gp29-like protein
MPARLTAAPPAKQSQTMAMVQDANPGLARYLRPQSAFQWWTLPYLSAITPQYIQTILIGAMSGNHVPAWQLFDLMIDTNPEIAACIGEYVDGILEKNLIIEPYHEEDEQPSKNAIRNQKIVAAALRNMRPDPANDENALEGTIRDILFGRFHGQSILEADWFDTFGTGEINTVTVPNIDTIAAPRATFWVHPVCYAYDVTGRIGLRLPPELIKQQSKAAKGFKPGAALDVGTGAAMPWSGFTGPSRPDAITDFPRNQFLISIFKAKTGSALSGSCLRPLAWWWCVSNFAGDWLLDLAQIFGIPFRKAKYQQGVGEAQKSEAREMLQNMGSRGWCLLDERVDVEFESAIESGAQSPQGYLVELAERQFRKVILRQTMTGSHGTTGKGGGQAFGQTEKDVKEQCLNAGAKFACSVLREQLARHVLLNNLNDDSELPFISLSDDDQGGLDEAQTIQALQSAGAGKAIPLNWINRRFNIPQPTDDEETLADAQPVAAPLANGQPGSAAVPAARTPTKPGDKEPAEAAQLEAAADEGGSWITANGQHIFIKDGQSEKDAIAEHFAGKDKTETPKAEEKPSQHRAVKKSGIKIATNEKGEVVGGPKEMIGDRQAAAGEYYHGTSPEAAEKILKEGIKPTDKTYGYKAAFVGQNKGLAQSYGAGASAASGSKEVAVIVVKHDGKDGLYSRKDSPNVGFNPNGIKPEQIDRVEYYRADGGKDEKPIRIVRPGKMEASTPPLLSGELEAAAKETLDPRPSTLDAPTAAYQEKALQQYSKAFAEDVQHVIERLAAILEIKDDALFKTKLERFLTDYPQLKKDVLADPAAARALQPIIATALANGLASKVQPAAPKLGEGGSPKSKVEARQPLQAGDVEGHDFHGNQYVQLADEHWAGTPKEMHAENKTASSPYIVTRPCGLNHGPAGSDNIAP